MLSLNGWWKGIRWPFPVPEESILGRDKGNIPWEEIEVPGHVFIRSPFTSPSPEVDEIKLTHIDTEDGCILKRGFTIPSNFKGQLIKLRFESVYPRVKVWVNGSFVGENNSGLTPFEFDITSLCKFGKKNTMALRIYRKGPQVRLDMPRWVVDFCGVARSVSIHAVPQLHIEDYHVIPTLDDEYKDGILQGRIFIRNDSSKNKSYKLGIQVYDGENKPVFKKMKILGGSIRKVRNNVKEFEIKNLKVRHWTAETPNLYTVSFMLWEGKGGGLKPSVTEGNSGRLTPSVTVGKNSGSLKASVTGEKKIQEVSQRIGFRRFELKDERPLLNGVPIKFRGINRLDWYPEKGLTPDIDFLRRELFLMKRVNINGIRTHLFPCKEFVELCDEMGFYIVQEIPIDWCPDMIIDSKNMGFFLDRIKACITRDRNNPSILAWTIGNENLVDKDSQREDFIRNSKSFDKFAKELDPVRPTLFPPPGPLSTFDGFLETNLGDISDIHYNLVPVKEFQKTGVLTYYTSWERNKETVTKEELKKKGWKGVWFCSEYPIVGTIPELLEAPYLSVCDKEYLDEKNEPLDTLTIFRRRLQREWGFMENDPTCLGGAFFSWRDPSVGKEWQWINYDEGMPWGIVDPYLNLKPNFWILRSIFAPIKVQKMVELKEVKGEVEIEIKNCYSFTSLKDCKCFIQESASGTWFGMTEAWKEVGLDIPPNTTRNINIKLGDKTKDALKKWNRVVIRFNFMDPEGYVITVCDTVLCPVQKGKEELQTEPDFYPMGDVGEK